MRTRLLALATVPVVAGLALTTAPAAPAAPAARTAPASAPADEPDPADQPGRDRGAWRVTALGEGRYEVTWTSPTRLPTNTDRPVVTGAGLDFAEPTVDAAGRTVQTVVTADAAPRAADLDVVLSGDRLDEPGFDPAAGARAPVSAAPPTTPLPAADPATPGPFRTVTSDYELPGVKLRGMPEPIEMVGHVVEPAADAATGPRPLVLFLHGRHGVCYDPTDPDAYSDRWPCSGRFEEIPSQLGYDYVQRLLASQGYATVSVRVNGINAQDYRLDDGGADARAQIVRRHLDHWADLAAEHQVDLSRVVLVGHSRGGEGVDRASIQVPAGAPYTIAGQVLLAPTDFASHTAPYVPTVTVLPYCDGDVFDIQGQKFTDVGRDLTNDDTSLKSSVLVMGANHNFFNTEWTPGIAAAPSSDDWGGGAGQVCGRRHPGRLSAAEQRAVGKAYVAGAVRLFTDATDGSDYLPLFDGSHVTVPSIGDADVRSHAIGGGRDERRPGIEATPTLANGRAETKLCAGVTTYTPFDVSACGRDIDDAVTPHWVPQGEGTPARTFFEMSWSRAGAVGGLRFSTPLDLSVDRLELRTILDPDHGPIDLRLRLTDGSGGTAVVVPEGGPRVAPLLRKRYLTKMWAQSLYADASSASGLDASDVRSVELLGGDGGGHVWVADLAAAPAATPAAPAQRMPTVSLGTVTVPEGDPAGDRREEDRLARVPFTISGTVTRPSKFVVLTAGQERGSRNRFVVDVAPGQTRGTIPVAYTADRLDDQPIDVQLAAWGMRGLTTDDYLGRLRITDDDPDADLRVSVPRRTVREGQDVVLRFRTTAPADYELYAVAEVVRGPGENLRQADVPAAFMEDFTDRVRPRRPLYRSYVYVSQRIRAGGDSATLTIPVARDGRREGTERLYLRVRTADGRQTIPITVRDAA
ncbi:hypothetical protein [Nocardioides marinquilinus]|uniref:hypothetical protein n=1 Tax=Nocardioides marinquilinus TaxID=1210400 RepID=UPI0031E61C74